MRKITALLAGFAAICFAPAVMAQGEDTDNMTVTANVETLCSIGSVETLAFGNYANSLKSSEAEITVTCVAADAKAKLSLGDGMNLPLGEGARARRMKYAGDADHFLAYNLKVDDDEGLCWGGMNVCEFQHEEDVTQNASEQSFQVYGELPGSQGLFAGAYSDTVVVTVTF